MKNKLYCKKNSSSSSAKTVTYSSPGWCARGKVNKKGESRWPGLQKDGSTPYIFVKVIVNTKPIPVSVLSRHMWSRTCMPIITTPLVHLLHELSWTPKNILHVLFHPKKYPYIFLPPFFFFLSHYSTESIWKPTLLTAPCMFLFFHVSCVLPHNPTFKVACSQLSFLSG